ncbi:unnamed protein product [Arctogadus glacialis]
MDISLTPETLERLGRHGGMGAIRGKACLLSKDARRNKVGFLDKPLCSWRKGEEGIGWEKQTREGERESERAKGQKGGRLTEKPTWWQPVQSD